MRRGLEATLLTLACALPIALAATRFHIVPTPEGPWHGITDPPSLARSITALILGALCAAWAMRQNASVRRLLWWFGCAAAPFVPLLTGTLPSLLILQGPALALLIAPVGALALARAGYLPHALCERCARPLFVFAAAFIFYCVLMLFLPGPAGPQGDEPHYLTMMQSLKSDGDLDLGDEFAEREYASFFVGTLVPHASPASPEGKLYAIHTPGLPLLALPAYVLGGAWGVRLALALLSALTCVVVFRLVFAVIKQRAAALMAAAALALTPPFAYYAFAIYPETPAALCMALLLLAAREEAAPRLRLTAACAAAALPWLHPKFLPLAALGVALLAMRKETGRARWLLPLPLIAATAGLLMYLHDAYGRASLSAAYGASFARDVRLAQIPLGLTGLLLDRQFGLWPAAPMWALIVPGALLLARRRCGDTARVLLLSAAVILVGAAFSMWWGGTCPPARFVIPALPALALVLAPALLAWSTARVILISLGVAILGLAADAPRVLHNRPDGESALLRYIAPAFDLDARLPSIVLWDIRAFILCATLLAALACVWRFRLRGALIGTLAFVLTGAALHTTPLINGRQATVHLLDEWNEDNVRGLTDPLTIERLRVPLDLPGAPWRFAGPGARTSQRVDLPPGRYRAVVTGSIIRAVRTAHVVRVDLVASELLLARGYIEDGQPLPRMDLTLPGGARRMAAIASWLQDEGDLQSVTLEPVAIVPRARRGEFYWPRNPATDIYRVPSGALRLSALSGGTSERDGFAVAEDAAFVVECSRSLRGPIVLTIERARPAASDTLEWCGRAAVMPIEPRVLLRVDPTGGVALGDLTLCSLRLRASEAWLSATAADQR